VLIQCERCKEEKECRFYGTASDVEEDKAQNGEWLCVPCVDKRCEELDAALWQIEEFLNDEDSQGT
jgi:protein-tyrosine phosphatase